MDHKIVFKSRKVRIFLVIVMFFIAIGTIGAKALYSKAKSYYRMNPPISEHVDNDIDEESFIAHWPLDQIEDCYTPDQSGFENDARFKTFIISDVFNLDLPYFSSLTNGSRGKSFHFKGKQWISAGNLKSYNSDTFTIALWVWREHDKTMVPTIAAKSSWPFYDGWWLCTELWGTAIDMGIAWGDDFVHISSGYELPLQEWHHIAVTMDNINHEIQFYIDGAPYGEKHCNIPEWVINWNHDLYIGEYDGSGRWPWFGRIDEVYYFDRIISHDEVQSIYEGSFF